MQDFIAYLPYSRCVALGTHFADCGQTQFVSAGERDCRGWYGKSNVNGASFPALDPIKVFVAG